MPYLLSAKVVMNALNRNRNISVFCSVSQKAV